MAQQVARRIPNPKVVGSNPTVLKLICGLLAQLVEHTPNKRDVTSSIPVQTKFFFLLKY